MTSPLTYTSPPPLKKKTSLYSQLGSDLSARDCWLILQSRG